MSTVFLKYDIGFDTVSTLPFRCISLMETRISHFCHSDIEASSLGMIASGCLSQQSLTTPGPLRHQPRFRSLETVERAALQNPSTSYRELPAWRTDDVAFEMLE